MKTDILHILIMKDKEELLSFSPIRDYTGRLELHFLPQSLGCDNDRTAARSVA